MHLMPAAPGWLEGAADSICEQWCTFTEARRLATTHGVGCVRYVGGSLIFASRIIRPRIVTPPRIHFFSSSDSFHSVCSVLRTLSLVPYVMLSPLSVGYSGRRGDLVAEFDRIWIRRHK